MGEMAEYYGTAELYADDHQCEPPRRKRQMKPKATMTDVRRNQFYVGSRSALDRNWGHKTEAEAIKHARELLDESEEPFTFIVKIVKVVKRVPRPAVVVKV